MSNTKLPFCIILAAGHSKRLGRPKSLIDINGDYGLTEYAYAIVDKPENLQKIKDVFDTKYFRNLMELSTLGKGHINYRVISIFKIDFNQTL